MKHSVTPALILVVFLAACSSGVKEESPGSASSASSSAPPGAGRFRSPAAGPESSLASGQAAPSDRSVYYDFDNSTIHAGDLRVLQNNARYLGAHPNVTVTIEGNCDERGSGEYNVGLGERRALAAKKLLTSYGASASQIRIVSFGKEKPRATCHEESCWQQNRRSDLDYQAKG